MVIGRLVAAYTPTNDLADLFGAIANGLLQVFGISSSQLWIRDMFWMTLSVVIILGLYSTLGRGSPLVAITLVGVWCLGLVAIGLLPAWFFTLVLLVTAIYIVNLLYAPSH